MDISDLKMEDIRKLLSSYLQKVEGLLGIVLSDRDGVPILRSVLEFLNNLWGAKNRVGIGLSYRPATHCPKTLETKIMLLELMLYRMYTCALLNIKKIPVQQFIVLHLN